MTNLIPRYREEPWIEHATCRSIGTAAFFPEIGEDWQQARNVCLWSCTVRLQCLDYAMRMEQGRDHKTRFGVYGAMSPLQRKRYESAWMAEQEAAA